MPASAWALSGCAPVTRYERFIEGVSVGIVETGNAAPSRPTLTAMLRQWKSERLPRNHCASANCALLSINTRTFFLLTRNSCRRSSRMERRSRTGTLPSKRRRNKSSLRSCAGERLESGDTDPAAACGRRRRRSRRSTPRRSLPRPPEPARAPRLTNLRRSREGPPRRRRPSLKHGPRVAPQDAVLALLSAACTFFALFPLRYRTRPSLPLPVRSGAVTPFHIRSRSISASRVQDHRS